MGRKERKIVRGKGGIKEEIMEGWYEEVKKREIDG